MITEDSEAFKAALPAFCAAHHDTPEQGILAALRAAAPHIRADLEARIAELEAERDAALLTGECAQDVEAGCRADNDRLTARLAASERREAQMREELPHVAAFLDTALNDQALSAGTLRECMQDAVNGIRQALSTAPAPTPGEGAPSDPCPSCQGQGVSHERLHCPLCHGTGDWQIDAPPPAQSAPAPSGPAQGKGEAVLHNYLFDVKLFAAIRVDAESEAEARAMLVEALDCATANLGAWPNGDPILCEVSLDDPGNIDLVEVDGDAAE